MKSMTFRLSTALTGWAVAAVCLAQPAPPMQREPDEVLPPLPAPTESQLQRGRELLDKIAHVIADVPLTDAEAVLKVFGFTELYTWTYPTYVMKVPKGKGGGPARSEDLIGTGFTDISVAPWVSDTQDDKKAVFSAGINTKEACISIDEVRHLFSGQAQARITISRITDIHPVARPPRLNKVGHISFRPIQTALGLVGRATFTFDYQVCLKSFGFSYLSAPDQESKK